MNTQWCSEDVVVTKGYIEIYTTGSTLVLHHFNTIKYLLAKILSCKSRT